MSRESAAEECGQCVQGHRHGDCEVSECDAEAADWQSRGEMRTPDDGDGREDDGDDEEHGDVSRSGNPAVYLAAAAREGVE